MKPRNGKRADLTVKNSEIPKGEKMALFALPASHGNLLNFFPMGQDSISAQPWPATLCPSDAVGSLSNFSTDLPGPALGPAEPTLTSNMISCPQSRPWAYRLGWGSGLWVLDCSWLLLQTCPACLTVCPLAMSSHSAAGPWDISWPLLHPGMTLSFSCSQGLAELFIFRL